MQNIHIIIFSFLSAAGGGRETWLNMFLPELYKQTKGLSSVYIYYVKRKDEDELLKVVSDSRFHFIPVESLPFSGFLANSLTFLKYTFQVAFNLKKRMTEKSIVLCVGSFYELFPVWLLRKLTLKRNRFKYIVWLRTIWQKQMKVLKIGKLSGVVLRFEHNNLNLADLIIANGWDTADFYKKEYNLGSIVIPNAIRLEDYAKVKVLKETPTPIVITYIGRLSQEKGLRDYWSSIILFNETYPQYVNKIRFEVVGDGPLKSEASKINAVNYIYRGAISNESIIAYINNIHVGVALTYSCGRLGGGAGVSNQLLELIGAKRLIIAWDTKIFTQILSKETAFLVKESDLNGLVNVYKKIVEDYSLMMNKLVGLEKIQNHFSLQHHVCLFLEAIKEL